MSLLGSLPVGVKMADGRDTWLFWETSRSMGLSLPSRLCRCFFSVVANQSELSASLFSPLGEDLVAGKVKSRGADI